MKKYLLLALFGFGFGLYNICSAQNAPVASFSCDTSNTGLCCFTFSDLSTNSPTSWSWTFPGGSPAASTSQNTVVCYSVDGFYNVTLTATNSFGSDTATGAMTIYPFGFCYCNSNVGIYDLNNDKFIITVYPNPITDKLNITLPNNEQAQLILYDIASRKLLEQTFFNSVSINTTHLDAGIYFYQIISANTIVGNGEVVKE